MNCGSSFPFPYGSNFSRFDIKSRLISFTDNFASYKCNSCFFSHLKVQQIVEKGAKENMESASFPAEETGFFFFSIIEGRWICGGWLGHAV